MTAMLLDAAFIFPCSLEKKPGTLLSAVIAGELGCLSMITYILPPPHPQQQHL